MGETDNSDQLENEGLRLESINAVTWEDDDGTAYKRVFRDGEIKDIEVPA